MEKRRMGRHGLEVPALCLATMTFGLQVDEPGSRKILDKAFDHRLTFLDTADAYPLGGSLDTIGDTEAIIGRRMKDKGNRDQIQLATKCFAPTRRSSNNIYLSRQHILESVEASLRRLQTDHIDLYQSHGSAAPNNRSTSLIALDIMNVGQTPCQDTANHQPAHTPIAPPTERHHFERNPRPPGYFQLND